MTSPYSPVEPDPERDPQVVPPRMVAIHCSTPQLNPRTGLPFSWRHVVQARHADGIVRSVLSLWVDARIVVEPVA